MSENEVNFSTILDGDAVRRQQTVNPFEKVSSIVFSLLEDAILTSKLKPGEKLTITKLATMLQVSATPVREAVDQLVQKGLVTVEKRDDSKYNNYFVFDLEPDKIGDLFLVRKAIESTSAYICAQKNWLVDMDALDAIAVEFHDALHNYAKNRSLKADPWRTADMDRGFHNMLVTATGNQYLIDSYARLEKTLYYLSIRTNRFLESEAGDQLMELGQQHVSICNAIKLGFPEMARSLMDEHIDFCANSCLKNRSQFMKRV